MLWVCERFVGGGHDFQKTQRIYYVKLNGWIDFCYYSMKFYYNIFRWRYVYKRILKHFRLCITHIGHLILKIRKCGFYPPQLANQCVAAGVVHTTRLSMHSYDYEIMWLYILNNKQTACTLWLYMLHKQIACMLWLYMLYKQMACILCLYMLNKHTTFLIFDISLHVNTFLIGLHHVSLTNGAIFCKLKVHLLVQKTVSILI